MYGLSHPPQVLSLGLSNKRKPTNNRSKSNGLVRRFKENT